MYLNSTNIKVFPLAKNRDTDPGARHMYESNIANIIRQLIDNEGYIIKATELTLENGCFNLTGLEFNLHGYYVCINASGDSTPLIAFTADSEATALYASLSILNGEISGQDETDLYRGIEFTFNKPSNVTAFIKLFNVQEDTGVYKLVPVKESFQKFDAKSLNITKIDGKPL